MVADDLLVRLHLQRRRSLKIGKRVFRIASVVVNEPDRLSGNFAAGPRVLISREGLEASGIARAWEPCWAAISLQGPEACQRRADLRERRCGFEDARGEAAAEAQVIDYRETNPALTQGLDRATSLLSLDEPGGVGSRCHGRRHGDACAPATASGHDCDHEVAWRELGRDHKHLLDRRRCCLGCSEVCSAWRSGAGVQMAFPYLLAGSSMFRRQIHIQMRRCLRDLAQGC